MELVRMKLADLRPNPMNPRRDFGDLEAFADTFEVNGAFPGEPFTPLMAVRDANVARIVDGERRYRAMKARGKADECWVYLYDSMDEAESAIAMLAVDDRQSFSDDERGAGYQQALMLGVPEEKVDRLAGRKVSGALRRAIKRNGGKALQVSTDRLLAADEFADSDEDYAAVMDARDYAWTARRIHERRESERKAAELEEAIAEIEGLQVADKRPKGAELFRSLYSLKAEQVRMEGPTWAAAGHVLVRPRDRYLPWELCSAARELTPEQESAAKVRNRWRKVRSDGQKRRREWLGPKLIELNGKAPFSIGMCVAQYCQDWRSANVEAFCADAGVDFEEFPIVASGWMVADSWIHFDNMTNMVCDGISDGLEGAVYRSCAESHIELMRSMKADGYELSEAELDFISLCEHYLAEFKKAEAGKEAGAE